MNSSYSIKSIDLLKLLYTEAHEVFYKMAIPHGPIFNIKVFNERISVINSSETAKYILSNVNKGVNKQDFVNRRMRLIFGKGLIVSEQYNWLNERRILYPVFQKSRSDYYKYQIATLCSLKFESHQRLIQTNGTNILEFSSFIRKLLMEFFIESIIGSNSRIDMQTLLRMMDKGATLISRTLPINIPFITSKKKKLLQSLSEELDQMISELVLDFKPEPGKINLLQILKETHGLNLNSNQINPIVLDEVKSILAGIFTTSDAILWTIYNIERNPGVKAQLIDVIDNEEMFIPLLFKCIYESIRLYPPVWSMWYYVENDVLKELRIPKKTTLLINLYNIHRDPKYYSHQDDFSIGRNFSNNNDTVFLPFGAGPRKCIGANVAMVIIPEIISYLYKNFDVNLINLDSIKPIIRITLTQNQEFKLRLTKKMSYEFQ